MLKIVLFSIFLLFNNVYNVHAAHSQVAADLETIREASSDVVQMTLSRLIPYQNKIQELADLESRQSFLSSDVTHVVTEQTKKKISDDIKNLRTELDQNFKQDCYLNNILKGYRSQLDELNKSFIFIYTHRSCDNMCDG